MRYYVEPYGKDTVFHLAENELKLTVVSSKTLDIVRQVNLEAPSFYKKMPKDFYKFEKSKGFAALRKSLETWAMGYSAITETAVTVIIVITSL